MCIAPTGSGKTLAYALPLVPHVLASTRRGAGPIALVIAPTRELVAQIAKVCAPFKRLFDIIAVRLGSSVTVKDRANSKIINCSLLHMVVAQKQAQVRMIATCWRVLLLALWIWPADFL